MNSITDTAYVDKNWVDRSCTMGKHTIILQQEHSEQNDSSWWTATQEDQSLKQRTAVNCILAWAVSNPETRSNVEDVWGFIILSLNLKAL